ncbi:hypothetical protein [Candidatus Leptofilum sp.]|uniref:hypothetical protein n=1 Tax=Candidatus Leptofilum sp. TaxID=3241576 RepID=UPI003B5B1F9A
MYLVIGILGTILAISLLLILALRFIAMLRGTHQVEPSISLENKGIKKRFYEADYVDSYRAQLRESNLQNIEAVAQYAFQKGQEVGRSKSEIVFQEGAPGLGFIVAYKLEPERQPKTITMTTAVSFNEPKGNIYFRLICPIHCTLLPFLLSRMARA